VAVAVQPANITLDATAIATSVLEDENLKIIVLLDGYYN